MSGFLSKLFWGKQPKENINTASNIPKDTLKIKTPEQPWSDSYPDSENGFLIREIKRSPYVHHEYDDKLIAHINKEIDIFSQGDYIKAFTPHAIEMHVKPIDILFSIQRNSSTKRHILEQISQFKNTKVNEYEYACAGDERDCEWCSESNGKKFDINDDLILKIESNCECQYCRSTLLASIDW